MTSTMRNLRRAVALLGLTAVAFVLPLAATAAPEPVMTGLDNPRGLAWGPEGALYVAEAGKGGPGVCVPTPRGRRALLRHDRSDLATVAWSAGARRDGPSVTGRAARR